MLTGPGRLGGSSGTVFRKRIPATARIPLEAVYWQLSRSIEQEPPPVMCAPPGSGSTFVQHFDELSITLRGVSALDKCPGGGTQVEGSFDFCMGNACADHVVRGAIDGVGFAAQTIASTWVDSAPFVLSDGSYLFNTRIWSVGTSAENPGMLLFPSPQSPLYGRIVCVGSGRSTGTDQARTWTLSDLSLLGPCPAGGSNSVEMCFR